jgi:KipI family sensor histidine kinase inhibitor
MNPLRPTVLPFGDSAVFVELGGAPGVETSRRLRALALRIRSTTNGLPGWSSPIPAATSILVPVDPVEPGAAAAARTVRSIVEAPSDETPNQADADDGSLIEIPVRYGGDDGPDLEAVAALTGLAPGEVIERHAAVTYTALFIGFAPGFAYLGPLDPRLVVVRRDAPRQRVPAGSVAIAGPQTAIYPVDSPGGWWIIGRTSVRVWDPGREPAALLAAGSRVRFSAEPR